MDNTPDIWEFLEENKRSIHDYIELKIQVLHLKLIRKTATIGGLIAWLAVMLIVLILILLFAGLSVGFWLSGLLGGYIAGFGATAGIFMLIAMLMLLFRKQLFINPFIRIIIREQTNANEEA